MRQSKAPDLHKKFEGRIKKAKVGKIKKIKVSRVPRREMLIMYYEGRGFNVVPGKTSKFVTMEKAGQESKVFIGRNGGVMRGKNISSAYGETINYAALERWFRTEVATHSGSSRAKLGGS